MGDRVLFAVSGGADSLVMASLFNEYRHSLKDSIVLHAVNVDIPQVSLSEEQKSRLYSILGKMSVDLTFVDGKVSDDVKFNCYTCAKERRKQLCIYCDRHGFDSISFGHQINDYVETGLMNLIYHGSLESLQPKASMFNGIITVIRPILNISKRHIVSLAKEKEISAIQEECPYAKANSRENVRELLQNMKTVNRTYFSNLKSAIDRWNGLDSS